MFTDFSHYLAYGSTDQQTLLALTDAYDGLLVPGTIAAVQRQGTGGFVLSMSTDGRPYVIDPRFPLFQQAANPKKVKASHEKLSEILHDPALISYEKPRPEEFTEERLRKLATAWVEFNGSYGVNHVEKFDKYAKRLQRDEAPTKQAAKNPTFVFPLYFVVSGPDDPWWPKSERFWEITNELVSDKAVRVVATDGPFGLAATLSEVSEQRVAIWASGLDEMSSSSDALAAYGAAVSDAATNGKELFALYGGYFHVMLRARGLRGISHGIGFGEHRDWKSLDSSGAPPPRFYLPRAHRYIPQDLAQTLWEYDRDITSCDCNECEIVRESGPAALDYHALMKHSVRMRDQEIMNAGDSTFTDLIKSLEGDLAFLVEKLGQEAIPVVIARRAMSFLSHLDPWIAAGKQI